MQSAGRLACSTHSAIPTTADTCACSFPGLPTSARKRSPASLRAHATTQQDAAARESEDQRLKLDADARSTMAAVAAAQEGPEGQDTGAWKWAIRKRVWDLLESENLAQVPRPVHHRIPNFVGAGAAAARVRDYGFIELRLYLDLICEDEENVVMLACCFPGM